MSNPGQLHKLAPWPVRVLVFAAMIVAALLAIRVIDSHVMARARRSVKPHPAHIPSVPQSLFSGQGFGLASSVWMATTIGLVSKLSFGSLGLSPGHWV